MTTNIIQWNINGFYSKLEELQLIISDHTPTVLRIQETNFNKKATLYSNIIYKKNRSICTRANGGVAIMINHNYTSKGIILHTDLEAIAVYVTLSHISITIYNIYIPNQKEFNLQDIERIIQQLPNPFIIVGDFNSHSEIWGSYKSYSSDKNHQ